MKFAIYAWRWQLSSPITILVVDICRHIMPTWAAIVLSQFVGACLMYPVDKRIFHGR